MYVFSYAKSHSFNLGNGAVSEHEVNEKIKLLTNQQICDIIPKVEISTIFQNGVFI